ncbi:MAG: SUMF1/EgtB/PvdO family nonheme iron enzyme [Planctomycetota bacterium]|nr:SUMF1/EgtB/PvdO family nonheme iron enzyme [Planctomycetota bacterium]
MPVRSPLLIGRQPPRTGVGRADLARLLGAADEPGIDVFALVRALGAVPKDPASGGTGDENTPPPAGGSLELDQSQPPVGPAPPALADSTLWPAQSIATPFWQAVEFRSFRPLVASPDAVSALPRLQWSRRPAACGYEPLLEWRRLAPRLRSALVDHSFSRSPDVPRLVERFARGRFDAPIPRRPLRRWGRPVQVIRDFSRRMIPFLEDQRLVIAQLTRLLGSGTLEEVRGCAPADLRRFLPCPGGQPLAVPYVQPPPGSRVLILGDLGVLDRQDSSLVDAWLRFGGELRGLAIEPLALVPCSLARMPRELRQVYTLRSWGAVTAGPSPGSGDRSPLLADLLALAAPALRLEPGLLRALRGLLPGASDPAIEAEFWQADELASWHPEAATLDANAVASHLLRAFRSRFSPQMQQRALQLVRAWRADVAPEVWLWELVRAPAAARAGISAAEWQEALNALCWLEGEVAHEDPKVRAATVGFLRQCLEQTDDVVRLDAEVGPVIARLERAIAPGGTAEPAPPARQIRVHQRGARLALRGGPPEPTLSLAQGSWLATLRGESGWIGVSGGDEQGFDAAKTETRVPPGETVPLILPGGSRFRIHTDAEEVTLARCGQPEWASAVGRDDWGLWADIAIPLVESRQPGNRGRVSIWQRLFGGKTKNAERTVEMPAPREVVQRLRWIPPGRFLMGSPTTQLGRLDREGPQHEVTLTRGYWMFDTPCTQALWVAVMGENPSQFVNPRRPVEQVAWNDVVQFVRKLNGMIKHLNLSLPTEAQWEYACRAGTTTALYTGEIEILGENNAPALDAIAWYGGNSGVDFELDNGWDSSGWKEKQFDHDKAGTHPVGLKHPNAWGLYDMLGNVWEWCADGQRPYSAAPQPNPVGPSDHGAPRVIRGGSWSGNARIVRAAYRNQYSPGDQGVSLGFRLVRVQEGS